MSTVLEILNATTAFFEKHKIPDARLDAQYLLAHGLNMKRMDLYLNFDKPLSETELDSLRPLVARRAKREPLQHIIGNTSFRGHLIQCDTRALIPRPETEMMVDLIQELAPLKPHQKLFDIGTGTGALAIAFAKEFPELKVWASDISTDALSLAKTNATANQVDKISFIESNLWENFPEEKAHVIVANLPYIPDNEKESLQEEVQFFDPHLALFGGPDGLKWIRLLLEGSQKRLASNAYILLEIAPGQEKLLESESHLYPWLKYQRSFQDFLENTRFVAFQHIHPEN